MYVHVPHVSVLRRGKKRALGCPGPGVTDGGFWQTNQSSVRAASSLNLHEQSLGLIGNFSNLLAGH